MASRNANRAESLWSRPRIERALRAWFELHGREASGADLSPSHARARAPRDGGARLRRLQEGWDGAQWPAASVVQYHYGSIRAANRAAIGDQTEPRAEEGRLRPLAARTGLGDASEIS